ncbi:phosphohistidine-like domain-containing protein [Luteolibacter marinus]|uniref:phosphohistidine-like domain-containing protein n=1 Tax=Luteolibacter marinus TaxID=2776705 RepID=UPI0018661804|nr:PEP/pyruvate-binding domain-containing protein [Luteolibacter marinus]
MEITAPAGSKPGHVLNQQTQGKELLCREDFPLDSGHELAAAVFAQDGSYRVSLWTDVAAPVVLHWGTMKRARSSWTLPGEDLRPPGSTVFGDVSVESPFAEAGGLRELTWDIPADAAPPYISFVIHQIAANQWLKHHGKNIDLHLAPADSDDAPLDALAGAIVDGETGHHGWTLMHRFNLCHDLIDDAGESREAWALLFVWLRYSAVRQLDWQRNYNTQPRELSHAQGRLTGRLAGEYASQPANRDLIRLMLACLGRGGDGQRIRDDILHIMHRHHIKEVGGTWMEQWHQKLHNNTTPDDIVICEAFLAFLHANGDPARYHETLQAGGVTPERLASLERPITMDPEWHPHLKDGLLHDFGHYLMLLKSVHSGTDLFTAIRSGGHLLEGTTRDTLEWVLHNFQNPDAETTSLVKAGTIARQRLHGRLDNENDTGVIKELIYLDLALEQALRTVIERATHASFSGEQLLELIDLTLQNELPGSGGEELAQCQREWQSLPADDRFGPDWALHAKAALDRLRRAVEEKIDGAYQLMQPKAILLGKSFDADEWVVNLFSEEVVRGQSVFLLSMLIHHFDPVLRKQAKLGDWLIVSPSTATGEVRRIESFRSIQGQRFESPTIIVADKVHGDEEPPEGVRAVITPSSVDLVSHVAVRARNASLLFATCYDPDTFTKLQSMEGQRIDLKVTPTGDVEFGPSKAKAAKDTGSKTGKPATAVAPAKPSLDVLPMKTFAKDRVGGKSWHLKELGGKLPDWIHTPRSIALPFGVFDGVLADPANASFRRSYQALLKELGDHPEPKLAEIRALLLDLAIPESLQSAIAAAMAAAGLPAPDPWSSAATRIKQVWASKWNDRAYFSREARGFPHDAVQMAVLIQEVVAAEFAFVIHTVNPFNGDPGEIYAEVVLGLGETLVGNYPGRALSFVCKKNGGQPVVLAYPGKSVGLFGGGLIFRSDSNAEDLEGYAGAGLYDSVLLDEPREQILDYTGQDLVWDQDRRTEILANIARIGEVVEDAFGTAQDIEGAFGNGHFAVVQTRPQVGL